jgi:hypothetical protein
LSVSSCPGFSATAATNGCPPWWPLAAERHSRRIKALATDY